MFVALRSPQLVRTSIVEICRHIYAPKLKILFHKNVGIGPGLERWKRYQIAGVEMILPSTWVVAALLARWVLGFVPFDKNGEGVFIVFFDREG